MKRIAIITENFNDPWYPDDIDDILGGSQEVIVLFAEALKRSGYKVSVFTYCNVDSESDESKVVVNKIKTKIRNDISYFDFDLFKIFFNSFETIILFKINPFKGLLSNLLSSFKKIIFWSSDVQKFIPNYNSLSNLIETKVCLTNFHKTRNEWNDAIVLPHGIDKNSLNKNKTVKIPNTVLYSSSFCRGLDTLLNDWSTIKKHFPELKLTITYGFKVANQFSSNLGKELNKKNEGYIIDLCKILDIRYLANIGKNDMEKLYWESEYWILPLKEPESELFCLNAIKAQYCACIPIVNKIGALEETVGDYIPFENLIKGDKTLNKANNVIPSHTWDEVINLWKPII